VDALKKLDFKARGCELYVNLEPCAHVGRTPPCVEAILRSGIRRVHIAVLDPNPLVAGKGVQMLRARGVEVRTGLLEREAWSLNESFFKFITTRLPFVVAKAAMTLDGKIATASGDSGQGRGGISGSEAHRYVHNLRRVLDAILVGAGTVLNDDPFLTCRLGRVIRQPIRVILDGEGRIPLSAHVLDTSQARTLVATSRKSRSAWREQLARHGVEVLLLPAKNGLIDIPALLSELGKRGVASLLVEGGSEVLHSFMASKSLDRLELIVTPHVFGGTRIPLIGGLGVGSIDTAYEFSELEARRLGRDILIRATPASACGLPNKGDSCSPV